MYNLRGTLDYTGKTSSQFYLFICDWAETLGTEASNGPITPGPDDRIILSTGGMKTDGKFKYSNKY